MRELIRNLVRTENSIQKGQGGFHFPPYALSGLSYNPFKRLLSGFALPERQIGSPIKRRPIVSLSLEGPSLAQSKRPSNLSF